MKLRLLILLATACTKLHGYAQDFYDMNVSNAAYTELTGATKLQYIAAEGGYYWSTNLTFPVLGKNAGFGQNINPPSNGAYLSQGYIAIYETPGYANTIVLQAFYDINLGSVDGTTEVSVKTEGTTGSRVVKFQYKNLVYNNDLSKKINMQIWLNEKDKSIIYHYGANTLGTGAAITGRCGTVIIEPNFIDLDGAFNLIGNPASPQVQYGTDSLTELPALTSFPANGTVYTLKPKATGIDGKLFETVPLTIYPNPAKNIINVVSPGAYEAEIYNGTGQKVKTISIGMGTTVIDIATLDPGIYFIKSEGFSQSFCITE